MVGAKEKKIKMKRYTLFIWLFLSALSLSAQENEKTENTFNWGIRAGVNAPFVDVRSASIDGVGIELPTVNSQIGFSGALFGRINFKRNFIQLEAGTSYLRSTMQLSPLDFIPNLAPEEYPESSVQNHIYALDIPLLYGYNFVKQKPYELAFFIGPKLKYIYKETFRIENIGNYHITRNESLKPLTISLVLGAGVSISRFFIDFRYEFALMNIQDKGGYNLIPPGSNPIPGVLSIHRGINLLSFSVGFTL